MATVAPPCPEGLWRAHWRYRLRRMPLLAEPHSNLGVGAGHHGRRTMTSSKNACSKNACSKDPRLIALLTGANKGLGKEVARQLARQGMTVLLGSRDKARGEAAAADFAIIGPDFTPMHLDVSDADSVTSSAARIRKDYGRLDVLINNAGIHIGRPAARFPRPTMSA
jgi:hypothetical protein